MRVKCVRIIGLCLLLGVAARSDELRAMESQVLRLAELHRSELASRQDWQSQRRLLQDQRQLLQKQTALLKAALDGQSAETAALASEKDRVAAEKAGLCARLDELRTVLLTHGEALLGLRRRLPPELSRRLADVFVRLQRLSSPSLPYADLPVYMQTQLSLMTEIEQYDHGIHVTKDVLTEDTQARREYDVLYLGLAAAYALSAGADRAGMGLPGPDGWQWQWHDEWLPAVKLALAVSRKEQPSQLVRLPLWLDGQGGQP